MAGMSNIETDGEPRLALGGTGRTGMRTAAPLAAAVLFTLALI